MNVLRGNRGWRRTALPLAAVLAVTLAGAACDEDMTEPEPEPLNPATAQRAEIDRFSADAGTLFVRTADNGLPAAGAAIDFDQAPFITWGLGPAGERTAYYNFDVQPLQPAPIWVFFRASDGMKVDGQLNVVDAIPGDDGYNDFWQVIKVMVPDDYVANTIGSRQEIVDAGYTTETTNMIVNCPIVPEGSTAELNLAGGPNGLHQGWYRDMAVFYFAFMEAPIELNGSGEVAQSPIYVSFNINPGQAGGGPPSGFKTEGSVQTHNVVATLPGDAGYSPSWDVNVYDNADFFDVHDLESALGANRLANGVADVNCPVVAIEDGSTDPATAERATIDRFSADAGHLFVRTAENGLPAAGEAIDFDQGPFITWGFGPAGERTAYYNFDVQPLTQAPIFVLFREGENSPVRNQLNIVDVVPGDDGYNDFWQVVRVTVPSSYVANTVTSLSGIMDAGYTMETTNTVFNCPIVPEGSTAELNLAGGPNELHQGWYKDMVVFYFTFSEAPVELNASGEIAQSPIYVSFNINPGQEGGGPPSGFMTEGTTQTHNVVATLPGDAGYSPSWDVNVYDNADFYDVRNIETALDANRLANGVADVNCPVVAIEDAPADPATAARTTIDRFSADAGALFVRTAENGLPAAGEAIDFDQGPFITHGLSPAGTRVSYYNFDVQPRTPAPIFVLFREGENMPVRNQLNIVDVVPGDDGYNDFWQVVKVTVPADYVANTVTSLSEIIAAGYDLESTSTLVNCPIVPDGSTAVLRWTDEEETGLVSGWYKGEVVYYFSFFEAPLSTNGAGEVPISPIYVSFNINPGEEGGGPPSGFMAEPGTDQTHNVVATIPGDVGYSPMWWVRIYDNADFDAVVDLDSARGVDLLVDGAANVNCPVVDAAP